jgi:hypothetical protein
MCVGVKGAMHLVNLTEGDILKFILSVGASKPPQLCVNVKGEMYLIHYM